LTERVRCGGSALDKVDNSPRLCRRLLAGFRQIAGQVRLYHPQADPLLPCWLISSAISACFRHSCPQLPSRDRRMPELKDSLPCRQIQSFCQSTQHQCYSMRCRFQPIQRRVQTRTEGRPICLTAQLLDLLSSSIQAIDDQGMDIHVPDPVISTCSVQA
jgi:hypothetical protein